MKNIFSRHGIPQLLRCDNGPQFKSHEFKQFATQYGFKLRMSSPKYAQSNRQAERAVQICKNIIKKSEDPFWGLLAYRNTPLASGAPPAQLLMGRHLRDTLPQVDCHLRP